MTTDDRRPGPAPSPTGPPPIPDPGTGGDAEIVLRSLLVDMGLDETLVDQAIEAGTVHLLALERLVALEEAEYTLDEVAEMSGLPPGQIRSYWRALGFPEPRAGERVFSETDLDMLASVLPFAAEAGPDGGLALQMARVIGSSMARVATAQIEAIEHQVMLRVERTEAIEADEPTEPTEADEPTEATEPAEEVDAAPASGLGRATASLEARTIDDLEPVDDEDLAAAARQAAELLPVMPRLMEFVWRRHLGAAARRRIMRASASLPAEQACVGFADMVGFTAQTQQLPDDELAEVVNRFETIAYDTVITLGGRVVKTIGDEVMFLADGIPAAAGIALALAERFREDDYLSDVRVALASGPVLERDGDVYGSTVNKAHRIVTIAYPGSVVVSEEVADALAGDDEYLCRSIRSHYLKDIGRVPLFTLRRADDPAEPPYAHARARRAARLDLALARRRRRRSVEADRPDRDRGESDDEVLEELTTGWSDLPADLPVDLMGDELASVPTGQFEALTDAVLEADLDRDLQVELLADLEAARRLRVLEREAQQKAAAADLEAERKLVEIEDDARRRIEQLEADTRRKVEDTLRDAEEKSWKANEEANRKVRRVAEEVERKAERAEKDAQREARRRAARRKPVRARPDPELDRDPADDPSGDPRAGDGSVELDPPPS